MEKRFLVLLQLFCGTLITGGIAALATCWMHLDMISNLRCLYVALPITLCWWVTQKSDSILLFVLSGCTMTAGTFLLSADDSEQYMFTLITVMIWISFLVARYKHKNCWIMQPHFGAVAAFLGMYAFGSIQNFPYLCYVAHYFTCFYLLGMLLYTNQYRFLDFIQKNFQSANLPYTRIRSINRLLIAVVTAISALILFALPVSGMDGLFALIKKLLFSILRFLLALLEGGTPLPEEEALLPETFYMPVSGPPQLEEKTSPIWVILSLILMGICFIVLIAVSIKLLIYFVKHYHKRISKDGDEVEFIDQPAKTAAVQKESSVSRLPPRSNDPNVQIRKLYKKRILHQRRPAVPASSHSVQNSHPLLQELEMEQASPTLLQKLQHRLHPGKAELPDPSDTPAQIEADSNVADTMLHNIYEKARYSRNGCTKEDLDLLKNKS